MSVVEELSALDVIESSFHWDERVPAVDATAEKNIQSLSLRAAYLGWAFDELLRVETHYREHGLRSRTIGQRFHAAYRLWNDKAKSVLADGKALDPSFDSIIGLGSRIEDAREILSEFAIGAAGAKQLAELFREEAAEWIG